MKLTVPGVSRQKTPAMVLPVSAKSTEESPAALLSVLSYRRFLNGLQPSRSLSGSPGKRGKERMAGETQQNLPTWQKWKSERFSPCAIEWVL